MADGSVYLIQESTLTAIADAIRSKSGSTEEIQVGNMADEIMNLTIGGSAPRIVDVSLLAGAWVGNASPYSQIITVEGSTERTQVNLTPSTEQLVVFREKDVAFVTENNDGVISVFAIGEKPKNDYVIQATVFEVEL